MCLVAVKLLAVSLGAYRHKESNFHLHVYVPACETFQLHQLTCCTSLTSCRPSNRSHPEISPWRSPIFPRGAHPPDGTPAASLRSTKHLFQSAHSLSPGSSHAASAMAAERVSPQPLFQARSPVPTALNSRRALPTGEGAEGTGAPNSDSQAPAIELADAATAPDTRAQAAGTTEIEPAGPAVAAGGEQRVDAVAWVTAPAIEGGEPLGEAQEVHRS